MLIVSVTIVSFILSAVLVPSAPWIGNWVAEKLGGNRTSPGTESERETKPEVVIIGFGPAGQIAARPFIDRGQQIVVIDLNAEGVRKARQLGFRGEVGDATQSEVLEHAQVNQAKGVVIAIPHFQSAMMILETIRHHAPLAQTFVRSRYQMHTDDFSKAGAHVVVGDEEQVGAELSQEITSWYERYRIQTESLEFTDNDQSRHAD